MRLKEGVILSEIDGQYVIVDARDCEERFNGMLKMNKTAGFIASILENEVDFESIVNAMMEKYEVTKEEASGNAVKVIESIRKIGLLEE